MRFLKESSILLSVILILIFWLKLHNFTYDNQLLMQGNIKTLELPFGGNTPNGSFQISGKFDSNIFLDNTFHILPDDCLTSLKINDKIVDFSGLNINLCDWGKGFYIDLSKYMVDGENSYIATLKNGGGYGAFHISQKFNKEQPKFFKLSILFLIIIFILFFILFNLHLKSCLQSIILSFAMSYFIAFFMSIDYLQFGHDVKAHIDYVNFILNNFSLPNPKDGWEYHQPPLYYLIGALFYKIFSSFTTNPKIYQILSLVIFSYYLIFVAKILRIYIVESDKNRLLFYLALILTIFFGANMLRANGIGNDGLFYTMFAISLYYLSIWYKHLDNKNFIIFLIFSSLTLLSKSSALSLYAGAFVVILFVSYTQRKLLLKKFILLISTFIVSFSIGFYDNIDAHLKDKTIDIFMGSSIKSLHSGLKISNELENYISFDLSDFSNPFNDAWRSGAGRDDLITFMIKSLNFGEFKFQTSKLPNFINLLTIIICLYALIGFLLLKKDDIKRYFPIISISIFMIISLISLRSKFPYSCHQDIRLILPITIFIALMAINSIKIATIQNRVVVSSIGTLSIISLVILNLLFLMG